MAVRWGTGENVFKACSMEIFSGISLDGAEILQASLPGMCPDSADSLEALPSCLDPAILSMFEDSPIVEDKSSIDAESESTLLTALTEMLDNVDVENLSPFDSLPDSELFSGQRGSEQSLRKQLSRSVTDRELACNVRLTPCSPGKNLPRLLTLSLQRSDGEEEEEEREEASPGLMTDLLVSSMDGTDWEGGRLMPEQDGECVSVSLSELVKHMHPYCMAVSLVDGHEQILPEGGIVLEVIDQGEHGEPILAIPELSLLEPQTGSDTQDGEPVVPDLENQASPPCAAPHREEKVINQRPAEEKVRKSPSRRKKKRKTEEIPPAEGRVLRSRSLKEPVQVVAKKAARNCLQKRVTVATVVSAAESVTELQNGSNGLSTTQENNVGKEISSTSSVKRSVCLNVTASGSELDDHSVDLNFTTTGSEPPVAPSVTGKAAAPSVSELEAPASEVPAVAPGDAKPKPLSLQQYRLLRQQKKPAPVPAAEGNSTKWPMLTEAPKELPPIPCLSTPSPRDPRRAAPSPAKLAAPDVMPAWQPRGPAAPPTPEALLVPPASMVATTRKAASPQSTAPNPSAPCSASQEVDPSHTSTQPAAVSARNKPLPGAQSACTVSVDQKIALPAAESMSCAQVPKPQAEVEVDKPQVVGVYELQAAAVVYKTPEEPEGSGRTTVPEPMKHIQETATNESVQHTQQTPAKEPVEQTQHTPAKESIKHPQQIHVEESIKQTQHIPAKESVKHTPQTPAKDMLEHNQPTPRETTKHTKPEPKRSKGVTAPVVAPIAAQPFLRQPGPVQLERSAQGVRNATDELVRSFTSEIGIEASDLTSLLEQFEENQAKEERSEQEVFGRAAAVGNSGAEQKVLEYVRIHDLGSTAGLTPPATPPHPMWKPLVPVALLGKSKEGPRLTPSKAIQIEARPLPSGKLRSRPQTLASYVDTRATPSDHDYCLPPMDVPKELGSHVTTKTSVLTPQEGPQQQSLPQVSTTAASSPQSVSQEPPQAEPESAMQGSSALVTPDASPDHHGSSSSLQRPSRSPSPCGRTRGRPRRRYRPRTASSDSSRSKSSSGSSSSCSRSPPRKRYRSHYSSSSCSSSRSRSPTRRRRYSYSSSCSGSWSRSQSWSRSRSRSGSPEVCGQQNWSSQCSQRTRHKYESRHNSEDLRRRKEKAIEERRVVYVGRIRGGMTRKELRERFTMYGEIEECTLHFRDHGDNYGFVTYYNTKDAFTAIENGWKLRQPNELPFDLCFGGRRQFCKSSYADLDSNQDYEPAPAKGKFDALDFDTLLKQAQKSVRR